MHECTECGHKATGDDVRSDRIRYHNVRGGGYLCECCYDDYLDRIADQYG